MVKIYRLSPLAEADLEEIWLYTAKLLMQAERLDVIRILHQRQDVERHL